MKWLSQEGSTQRTNCGRFVIVQANSKDWIAYDVSSGTAGRQIGASSSDADARALCEAAERALMAGVRKHA